ncbi:hypothetical protein [Spirosoma spitsbergense]|uniref:hypothetical protein n=1 Tax=Spirosoma spitsbergense TaxID=431554 RepID=UPI00037E49E9|nr:hypothetical protein [Spirosoma spitsbergense]
MQGVSLITDPQGQPKILTIDIEQHDNQLDPFVSGLLDLIQQQAEETERADFRAAAHAALNRSYGDNEPDYSDVPAYTARNRS